MRKKLISLGLVLTLILGVCIGLNSTYGANERNAYTRIQCESFDEKDTTKNDLGTERGKDQNQLEFDVLKGTTDGAWVKFAGVNFGEIGANKVTIRYTGNTNCFDDARVELKLDSLENEPLVTVQTPPTGSWNMYTYVNAEISNTITGVHDVYFITRGSEGSGKKWVGNYDYIQFHQVSRDAYSNIEAETYVATNDERVKTEGTERINIGGVYPNLVLTYDRVNFSGNGANKVTVNYAHNPARCAPDAKVEVRLDSAEGDLIGEINLATTEGWGNYATASANLNNVIKGQHDIYLIFKGTADQDHPYIANVDYFKFEEATIPADKVEAEIFSENSGGNLKTENSKDLDGNDLTNVGGTYKDAWLKYSKVDFGSGMNKVTVRVASNADRCTPRAEFEIRTGALDGEIIGVLPITRTGKGWDCYDTFSAYLNKTISGTHDIYIIMKDTANSEQPYIANIDYFSFSFVENPDPGKDIYSNMQFERYIDWSGGELKLETSTDSNGKKLVNLGGTRTGSWVKFHVNFGGNGASKVSVRYALNTNASTTSRIELRLGAPDGEVIATVNLPQTGDGWGNYKIESADLNRQVTGEHDLYIVFLGDEGKWIGNFDYFVFEEAENPLPEPSETPSEEPSEEPTETPSEEPTEEPTETPSEEPTEEPTETPSSETEEPTETPQASEEPTETPTSQETEKPNTPQPGSSPNTGDDMTAFIVSLLLMGISAAAIGFLVRDKKRKTN